MLTMALLSIILAVAHVEFYVCPSYGPAVLLIAIAAPMEASCQKCAARTQLPGMIEPMLPQPYTPDLKQGLKEAPDNPVCHLVLIWGWGGI